ncbi:MAG TPA: nuclear transport factor 2 family protein [Micromonosporaceae bacterium]
MTSTPQEILTRHLQATIAEDLDAIVADYADDAVLLTPNGVTRGKDGIRKVFTALFADLPRANWRLVTQTFADDVLLLEWSAEAESRRVEDGIDTFVFREGLIRAQTVRYTLIG